MIDGCADPGREDVWINDEIKQTYLRLGELGWVHSVESWNEEGRLAGGLYGVAIGALFAGESMFFLERDASKVALAALGGRAFGPTRKLCSTSSGSLLICRASGRLQSAATVISSC